MPKAKKSAKPLPKLAPDYIPPPTELYIYIRRKGWLQPIPYDYKIPDLTFVKNYKKEENGNKSESMG
jgi:hypothetical protein